MKLGHSDLWLLWVKRLVIRTNNVKDILSYIQCVLGYKAKSKNHEIRST